MAQERVRGGLSGALRGHWSAGLLECRKLRGGYRHLLHRRAGAASPFCHQPLRAGEHEQVRYHLHHGVHHGYQDVHASAGLRRCHGYLRRDPLRADQEDLGGDGDKCSGSQMSWEPTTLALMFSGAVSTVGIMALQTLYQTSAPWVSDKSVVVVSCQEGVGYMTMQRANKAPFAFKVSTAATTPNVAKVSSFGDIAEVDYRQEDLFDSWATTALMWS